MESTNDTTTAEINRSWNTLCTLEHPLSTDTQASSAIDRMNLGTFRLVVMGEIKKGKSSFINALLGEEDLLPTASDVATSTVYKVIWGPTPSYKVFFKDQGDSLPKTISGDEIDQYGTENGNPNNEKQVDFIGIEIPNSFLADGLVIIDTPGVGGLFREHKEITWQYAPNADAIFFVLDSVESVISEDEIGFLKELVRDVTKRVFFIQTKIDIPDTQQWQTWVDRNQQILLEQLPELKDHLVYFPVSSKLKQIADNRHSGRHLNNSGFVDLINFIEHRLKPAKQSQIHRDTAEGLIGGVSDTMRQLAATKKTLEAELSDSIEALEQELTTTQTQYEQWHSSEFRDRLNTAQKRLAEIASKYKKELHLELDPLGPIVEEVVEAIRTDESANVEAIENNIESYRQSVFHECQVRLNNVVKGFRKDILEEMNSLYEQLIDQIYTDEFDDILDSNNTSTAITNLQDQSRGTFAHHRSWVRQGVMAAGSGVFVVKAAAILSGLSISALSGGVFVGALLAGSAVWSFSTKLDRDQLLAKVTSELRKSMEQSLRRGVIEFDDLSQNIQRQVTSEMTEMTTRRTKELKDRLVELQQTKGKSRGELEKELKEVEGQLQIYNEIHQPLLRALT
tara:strand:+ start:2584 stop:4452 length:1869 start_codon:yes stop_codon:yes gene_type:complete